MSGAEIELSHWESASEVEGVCCGPGAQRKFQFARDTREEFEMRLRSVGFKTRLRIDDHRPGSESLLASIGPARSELRRTFSAFKKALGDWELPKIQEPQPTGARTLSLCGGEFLWQGGESAALAHWHHFVWEQRGLETYRATRNGLEQISDSAKISPWLALGALSPRWVIQTVRAFENRFGASESTAAFVDEILWRDYFKHLALEVGSDFFSRKGISNKLKQFSSDRAAFRQWALGETGEPFVDAGMRELWWTGWISNRLRQNTSSFLAKAMGVDWTWGARWFEAHLIDEDPESNFGNWLYVSGVGTDPRDRIFNPKLQADLYDPHGTYRSRWAQRPTSL